MTGITFKSSCITTVAYYDLRDQALRVYTRYSVPTWKPEVISAY